MIGVIHVFEILGTIAFAISGALVAIGASLDVFGVVFVGCITAVGGGIVRDLLIGNIPPAIFSDFSIFSLAMVVSVTVFIIAYANRKKFSSFKIKTEAVNNIFDALGLAAFSVTGAEMGYIHGFADNGFIIVVIGMITGVGGGIFRDILTDTTPYVFKKHIYAVASILGCLVYFVFRRYFDSTLPSIISMVIIVSVRILATKYRWSLPKIKPEN